MLPTRLEIKAALDAMAPSTSLLIEDLLIDKSAGGLYSCLTFELWNVPTSDQAAEAIRRELMKDHNSSAFANIADSNEIAGTAAEQPFTFNPECITPAGWWKVRRAARIFASFKYSTNAAVNFTPRLKINGGLALNFGAQAMGNAVSNRQLLICFSLICRTVHASTGTIQCTIEQFRVNGTNISLPAPSTIITGNNVNAMTFNFTGQWATAHANNKILQEVMRAEGLN